MKIIIAPDSFKESLTAAEASAAMAAGVRDAVPDATVTEIPVADGGEGTVAAVARALDLPLHTATVTGPDGRPVTATWAGDGTTAVVELAEAAGLHLIAPADRDIWGAGTTGVGELLATALDSGARTVIVGLGGSVTTDGGLGLLAALGVVAVDRDGTPVSRDATGLEQATALAGTPDHRWSQVQVVIAGDVGNPLCGPRGAAAVFGPQKGATAADVVRLDAALDRWADLLATATGQDAARVRDTPGAGAAGGTGAALLAVLGARMRSGADLLLDLVDFRRTCAGADLVLTGEGRIDAQTGYGKAPARVAAVAGDAGVPVIAVGGLVEAGAQTLVPDVFTALVQAGDPGRPQEENLARAAENVRTAVADTVARVVAGEIG